MNNDYNLVIDPAPSDLHEHAVTLENGPVIEKSLSFKSAEDAIAAVEAACEKYETIVVRVWNRGKLGLQFIEHFVALGFKVIPLGK